MRRPPTTAVVVALSLLCVSFLALRLTLYQGTVGAAHRRRGGSSCFSLSLCGLSLLCGQNGPATAVSNEIASVYSSVIHKRG